MSKGPPENLVPLGRFGAPHGVRGEIKFKPYEGIEDFIWTEIYVVMNKNLRRLQVENVRTQTGAFLLTIRGINQREEAALHTGLEVSVPLDKIPEPEEGEYYYKDLEGLAVITDDGKELGFIRDVFSAGGGNDVFEVKGPFGEVLIPVTGDTILEVNLEEKRVRVHLLEGLLPESE
ncbi:MAG: ribosome maturation factor RimM [Thermodesulfobacteriota bacterium]